VPLLGDAVRTVLDRVLPDPEARAKAEAEVRKLAESGTFEDRAELAVRLAQIDLNKTEAAAGTYRGGWRPAVGWTCAAAVAWEFVARPVATWALVVQGVAVPALPSLDARLWELLALLLGVGGLRTIEKLKGKP
jgi:hypothetical protein